MIIFSLTHNFRKEGFPLKDSEIIEILRSESEEFKKYEVGHRELDQSLSELQKKKRPTTDEEYEMKKMQKQKLYYKDMMALMVSQYKSQHKN
jgi:uncharacterized protein YdcH (DUF465 family)